MVKMYVGSVVDSVEGRITALTALSNTWMVCSAELPLESLCHSASTDMFTIPGTLDFRVPSLILFSFWGSLFILPSLYSLSRSGIVKECAPIMDNSVSKA